MQSKMNTNMEKDKHMVGLAGIPKYSDIVARMRSYDHVVFDWDDTLVISHNQLAVAISNQMSRLGDVSYDTLHEYYGESTVLYVMAAADLIFDLGFMSKTEMHIISNKYQPLLLDEVKASGLSDFFVTVVGKAKKPNNTHLLTDIAKHGLYVGDQTTDAVFAAKAGWDFMQLTATELLLLGELAAPMGY